MEKPDSSADRCSLHLHSFFSFYFIVWIWCAHCFTLHYVIQEAEDFALAMMKLQEPNIKPSSGDGKNREILSDYMGEKAKTHVQVSIL